MLQNAYLLAKIGFDTAENGPHRFQKSAEWDTAIISAVAFFLSGAGKFTSWQLKVRGRSPPHLGDGLDLLAEIAAALREPCTTAAAYCESICIQ